MSIPKSTPLLALALFSLLLLSQPTLQTTPAQTTDSADPSDISFAALLDKDVDPESQLMSDEERAILEDDNAPHLEKLNILDRYQRKLEKLMKELEIDFNPNEEIGEEFVFKAGQRTGVDGIVPSADELERKLGAMSTEELIARAKEIGDSIKEPEKTDL